jgi:hypothetical protein
MKKWLSAAAATALLAGAMVPSHGQAPATVAVPVQVGEGPTSATVYGIRTVAPAASEVSRLMGQLREATEEAKKTELTGQLEKAVNKLFDEDMKAREAELTKLEERLKKLKDQLERRRKAKADIIQLQIKVLANEAEGLGFSRTLDQGTGGLFLPQAPQGINRSQSPGR